MECVEKLEGIISKFRIGHLIDGFHLLNSKAPCLPVRCYFDLSHWLPGAADDSLETAFSHYAAPMCSLKRLNFCGAFFIANLIAATEERFSRLRLFGVVLLLFANI